MYISVIKSTEVFRTINKLQTEDEVSSDTETMYACRSHNSLATFIYSIALTQDWKRITCAIGYLETNLVVKILGVVKEWLPWNVRK